MTVFPTLFARINRILIRGRQPTDCPLCFCTICTRRWPDVLFIFFHSAAYRHFPKRWTRHCRIFVPADRYVIICSIPTKCSLFLSPLEFIQITIKHNESFAPGESGSPPSFASRGFRSICSVRVTLADYANLNENRELESLYCKSSPGPRIFYSAISRVSDCGNFAWVNFSLQFCAV